MTDPLDDLEDDPRILAASREYLADLEAGRIPDRPQYLTRYPELASTLSECFDGIDLAQSLRPPAEPPTSSPIDATARPIGDFQIISEIGRGGMGVVYEAIQLSLGRRIALKVLPFAAALDAKHLQRFKNEAHAAAQLHHTNIVPVYAVGAERGVHFYAMQLISGRPLSAVIKEMRGDNPDVAESAAFAVPTAVRHSATTSNVEVKTSQHSRQDRHSFRTAARIAAQVADALEYAHEAGVIHRDVKPANLLIDSKRSVWVTDFGLAHVLADVGITQTGDLVGTLRYMSPEQAAGKRIPIDHRTDIYSLGATLYELLTLQPIFSGQDRATLLNQVVNDEPRPPRQWNRSIPIELETIVLKATAKSPVDRYATAGEMAADLRRFLEERPILARRSTMLDHVRKWMRRHPAFIRAALVLLVCGMIGLAISRTMIAHEQEATKAAYHRENQKAVEAEARFQMARRAADEMIRLAEDDLSENPFQEGLRKQLLETALKYYREFIDLRSEQRGEQADLEATRDRVLKILADLAVLKANWQVFLLQEPEVLNDLQASPEQRTQAGKLISQLDDRRFPPPHDLTPRERRQRSLETARENEAALAAILDTQQIKRLSQIALQCQGLRGFHEPDVNNVLKLTTDQKDQLSRMEGELFRPHDRDGRRPPDKKWMQDRMKTSIQKMLDVLTSEQREQWQTMTGKAYAGPVFAGGPFGQGRVGPPAHEKGGPHERRGPMDGPPERRGPPITPRD